MTTTINDVVTPENYASYSNEASIAKNALFQSGVIVTNPLIQGQANSGGVTVNLPCWKDISNDTDANVSSDDASSKATALTPKAYKTTARVSRLNQAWSAADLATEVAGSDPMNMVASTVHNYWAVQFQKRLIATIQGLVLDSVVNHNSDLVYSDLTGSDDGVFSASGFIRSAQTLGDAKSTLKTLVVHSEIQTAMSEQDLIDYVQDSQGNLTIPTYRGLLLSTDDTCLVETDEDGDVYSCYLLGAGAFGAAAGTPKKALEVERDGLGGDGGGIETLISRVSPVIAPLGYMWTEASVVGDSPTIAELKLAANYTRSLSYRKAIPLVVYKCRAEYLGS